MASSLGQSIGVGAVPDIYSLPYHSLDFNVFRNFSDNKHTVAVGVNNILNAKRRDFYQGYNGAEAIYSIFQPGRTYRLSYTLSF
jgi:outer membrane receptor protein involved in Fe transport